jgi:predicted 3-demethylubiquinone-9 3-methyltransferase (glyoxalase superfamily)
LLRPIAHAAPALVEARALNPTMPMKISPCLWFDHQAEDAARFYTAIFKDSKIVAISRYPEAGQEIHGKPAGSVTTVAFELNGQSFTALNGGQIFKFNEAVSFQIEGATQQEVDYYWERLSEGGDPQAQQCGWLKDKFGLSWQIVPKVLTDPDTAKSQRTFQAMLQMKKLDIERLQRTCRIINHRFHRTHRMGGRLEDW